MTSLINIDHASIHLFVIDMSSDTLTVHLHDSVLFEVFFARLNYECMTFGLCCDSTLTDNLSHYLTLPSFRPLACSSLQLVILASTFQLPPSTSDHGCALAAILLEPLFASTAATSAAYRPRHHGFSSHDNSPHLQPYWHLRPTHSCTPYASGPPLSPIHDLTIHTATTAHTATADSTVTAGVPTSTATTTAHSRPSHSTAIELQAQSTTATSRPHRHCTCSTPPLPLHQPTTLGTKQNTIGIPTPSTATSSTAQSNPHNGLEKQGWQGSPPLTSSPLLLPEEVSPWISIRLSSPGVGLSSPDGKRTTCLLKAWRCPAQTDRTSACSKTFGLSSP